MKREEIDAFLAEFHKKICKRGMNGNIRSGSTEDIADWAVNIAKDCLHEEEPTGVVSSYGFDRCPKCNAIVVNGNYCKICGNYIREVL